MPTTTSNYGWSKPAAGDLVSASQAPLASTFDAIDSSLKAVSDAVTAAGWTVTATKTADYVAAANEHVPVDASGGAVQITVPATAGALSAVQNIGATGTVTIIASAGTIDGSSVTLSGQYQGRVFIGKTTGAAILAERKPFGSPVQQSGPPADGTSGFVMRSDAILNSYIPRNVQTGDYTLVAADHGKAVEINSSSAHNVTAPSGLADGFACEIMQVGTGQVTVIASGSTLVTPHGAKTSVQGATLGIRNRGSNIFVVSGDATT